MDSACKVLYLWARTTKFRLQSRHRTSLGVKWADFSAPSSTLSTSKTCKCRRAIWLHPPATSKQKAQRPCKWLTHKTVHSQRSNRNLPSFSLKGKHSQTQRLLSSRTKRFCLLHCVLRGTMRRIVQFETRPAIKGKRKSQKADAHPAVHHHLEIDWKSPWRSLMQKI